MLKYFCLRWNWSVGWFVAVYVSQSKLLLFSCNDSDDDDNNNNDITAFHIIIIDENASWKRVKKGFVFFRESVYEHWNVKFWIKDYCWLLELLWIFFENSIINV